MRRDTFQELKYMIDSADVYYVAADGSVLNVRAVRVYDDGRVVFASDLADVDAYDDERRR